MAQVHFWLNIRKSETGLRHTCESALCGVSLNSRPAQDHPGPPQDGCCSSTRTWCRSDMAPANLSRPVAFLLPNTCPLQKPRAGLGEVLFPELPVLVHPYQNTFLLIAWQISTCPFQLSLTLISSI